MIKRIATLLAAAAAMVALSAVPAQAAPTCDPGLICWFDLNNWQGTKYKVAYGGLTQGKCYNMGTDPNTGIIWNDNKETVWWNGVVVVCTTHANFYENSNCGGVLVTQAWADGHPDNQMQSCTEPATEWNGPCGPPSNGAKRISSWKFWI
jgi:hypothetical protein